ncbi:unnamed protein product, partial [Ixodes pacificus]
CSERALPWRCCSASRSPSSFHCCSSCFSCTGFGRCHLLERRQLTLSRMWVVSVTSRLAHRALPARSRSSNSSLRELRWFMACSRRVICSSLLARAASGPSTLWSTLANHSSNRPVIVRNMSRQLDTCTTN